MATLLDRLGGRDGLTLVVTGVIARFGGHALRGVDRARLEVALLDRLAAALADAGAGAPRRGEARAPQGTWGPTGGSAPRAAPRVELDAQTLSEGLLADAAFPGRLRDTLSAAGVGRALSAAVVHRVRNVAG